MTAEKKILDDRALDILFREARTHNAWLDQPVSDVLLQAVYDLAKMGPTSANSCPARYVFVRSQAAKERLKPHLEPGNIDKTMSAPVTVIIGHDLRFHDHLPKLFPQAPAKSWFEGKPDAIRETAFRNASLEGAYLMLAARALGLDCGPMSGFKKPGVKQEFFPDSEIEPNFLCNLGYGDAKKLFPRNPRFGFDDICQIV